jgi:putative hemolysin
MTTSLIEIIIILILVLLNGVMAMSEIAIVSSRRVRLQGRAEAGDAGAAAALGLLKKPARFLSTVQIVITLVGILAGAFGGATLASELGAVLARVPALSPYAEAIGVGVVVIAITYVSLVVGELVPKQIALANPERIAAAVAPSLRWLVRVTSPLTRLLSVSTNALLRLLRVQRSSDLELTEDEIEHLIEQATRVGVFEPVEEAMVKQIFRVNERRIEALMTPRQEIVWLDLEGSAVETRTKILDSGYTVFPVARGDLDNLVGVVHAKDLLASCLSGNGLALDPLLEKAPIVPESTPAFEVLDRFREARTRVAMIIDEYGGTLGMVTTTDLLVEIVGDLPLAGDQDDPDVVLRADGTWLLDGMVPVDEVKELLKLQALPDEQGNLYQTLGGLIISQLGRIPKTGDQFVWEGVRFEVVDMDGRRVDKILVTPGGTARE